MRIYYGFDEVDHIKNAVVTTGSFDGVHMGHQVILQRLNEIARQENGESVLITFYPHPRKVLYPKTKGKDLLMINNNKEKIELLKKAGLDHLIFVKFTKEFAETTAAEFIKEYLIKRLHTRKIVTGENHHFGKNRAGDIEELKNLGSQNDFQVELIPHQDIQNIDVSSTLIRESIIRGKIEKANLYLTHPYFIIGHIRQGSHMFKRMGYITYIVDVKEKDKLLPPCGSYQIDVIENGHLQKGIAMMSTCTNSSSDSVLDIYVKNPIKREITQREISIQFIKELNVQDAEKKGSLLNSIMMKDLIRFDSNAS